MAYLLSYGLHNIQELDQAYLVRMSRVLYLRHWNVTTVDNSKARTEGVDFERNIVAAIQRQATGTCSDTRWITR